MNDGQLTIALLPGMDGTGDLFRDLVEFLPPSLKVMIVRYPTREVLSYARLERLVRDTCSGSGPFVVFAESFSTPIAIEFAATNPDNLRGLILCAGFATAPVKGLRHFLLRSLASLIFLLPMPTFAVKKWIVGPTAPPSLMLAVRVAVRSVKPNVLASRLQAVLRCDARNAAARITVPTLYIRATQDPLVDVSAWKELQKINPNMSVTELDGPHLIAQREPAAVARTVVDFLHGLPDLPRA